MIYSVALSEFANRDLLQITDYIQQRDGSVNAESLLANIESRVRGLSDFPKRGNIPKELAALGHHEYREIFFKPYRIIYEVDGSMVTVLVIADGRRDMRTLLQKRLLDT